MTGGDILVMLAMVAAVAVGMGIGGLIGWLGDKF